MTARLIGSLVLGAAGVASLAQADPGASWVAVGGWALLLAAFVNFATLRSER